MSPSLFTIASSSATGLGSSPLPAARRIAIPRKAQYACERCRVRKRRCDEGQPKCSLCASSGMECVYKGAVSRRYIQELESHCSSLRQLLATIKQASEPQRTQIIDSLDDELFSQECAGTSPSSYTVAAPSSMSPNPDPDSTRGESAGRPNAPELAKENAKISRDSDDRMSLHGPSSLYYLSPSTGSATFTDSGTGVLVNEALDLQQHLFVGWLDSLAAQTEVPAVSNETWHYLLRLHWTWVQPLFGFVHRKAFMRDMHRSPTRGSLFSPFLLYSLCAHAARKNDLQLIGDDEGTDNPFVRQARLLVFHEVERGSSLSAIQGLLLLSAKEIAGGRVCQAWVYLGIAIRMIQDLGIHLDGRETENRAQFTPEDLENRKHSFWSAYLWDKMVSLYLGRTPMLQLSRFAPPADFADPEAEEELWSPTGNRLDDFPLFMPTPTRGISTFSNVCGLACIINDVLLYDAGEAGAPKIAGVKAELEKWRLAMAPELKLNAAAGFPTVPPSHVINLNCLYHMISILLDRRMLPGPPTKTTVTAALEICIFAQFSQKHFCDRQAVLSHCYCVYTAATTFVYKLRFGERNPWLSNEDSMIVSSLQWCLQRLEDASETITAMQRPLAALQEQLNTLQGILPAATGSWFSKPSRSHTHKTVENLAPPAVETPLAGDPVLSVQDIENAFSHEFWNWPGGGEMAIPGISDELLSSDFST